MIPVVALVLGFSLQGVATLDDLPDNVPGSALASHPAVRRWVVEQRAALPELRAALASPSWKTRLGAAFALRDMGYSKTLFSLVEDPNPRVRDYVRAVVERPPHDPDLKRPAPYPRDADQRTATDGLLRIGPALTESERKGRTQAAVDDLLRSDLPRNERDIALNVASREGEAALEALEQRASTAGTAELLNALVSLTLKGAPDWLPRALAAAIDKGAADPDAKIRGLALIAGAALPEEERAARVARALGDPDPEVRRAGLATLVRLAQDAHDRGDPLKADLYLARVDASLEAEKDPETRDAAREGAGKGLDRIHYERRVLLEGEADDEGGTKRQRYLKVGKSLIAVSDREYELCLARGGGPYLSEVAFTELRKGVAAELRARSAPVQPPEADQPGEKPDPAPSAAADSSSKEAARETGSPDGTRRRLVAGVVVLLAVGMILLFRSRSKPSSVKAG